LRQSGMGAQACEGPYRFAQSIAPRGLAMEGARLREQFGCAAHEYILLPPIPLDHLRGRRLKVRFRELGLDHQVSESHVDFGAREKLTTSAFQN